MSTCCRRSGAAERQGNGRSAPMNTRIQRPRTPPPLPAVIARAALTVAPATPCATTPQAAPDHDLAGPSIDIDPFDPPPVAARRGDRPWRRHRCRLLIRSTRRSISQRGGLLPLALSCVVVVCGCRWCCRCWWWRVVPPLSANTRHLALVVPRRALKVAGRSRSPGATVL